ncbi:MAG TPA: hypothetical protein H9672_08625 [Firmicutes bacterium]|nr:hypothetical protein [Bacillota bacterium]
MSGFRDRLNRWMYGRYGSDQLNRFIMVVTVVCLFLSVLTRFTLFYWLSVVGIILMYFRLLSRNITRRSAENTKYLRMTAGIRGAFARFNNRRKDKTHCYFKCPSCRQTVRVPKGKGRISITCPKCRTEFIKKT